MESSIAGKLEPDKHDADMFVSEPIAIPYFNNEKLEIGFSEANHAPSLHEADKVLKNFLELTLDDKIKNSEIVKDYYDNCLKYGITQPLNIIEDQDVWNFVTPAEIIVDSDDLYVSCDCQWEEEHGLQLIFKNGKTLVSASGHE
ncbi:MAG: hypothetical protein AAF944_12120 [Bacteroidota bacterium]